MGLLPPEFPSPVRDERCWHSSTEFSAVPPGLSLVLPIHPAMNGWAIFGHTEVVPVRHPAVGVIDRLGAVPDRSGRVFYPVGGVGVGAKGVNHGF